MVGVKQQGIDNELALELLSEDIVGNAGGPSLKGQDIGIIEPVSGTKEWSLYLSSI